MATITICSDSVAPLILLEPKKTKVKEQIKSMVEDLELVLGNLKDVAKELNEHVYSLLITVLCGEEITHVQDQERWLHFAEPVMRRYPTSKDKGEAPARR